MSPWGKDLGTRVQEEEEQMKSSRRVDGGLAPGSLCFVEAESYD